MAHVNSPASWEQMPKTKSGSISMGACATFRWESSNNYALVAEREFRVISRGYLCPGCPPRPEQLIYAIHAAAGKKIMDRTRPKVKEGVESSPGGASKRNSEDRVLIRVIEKPENQKRL